MIDIKGVYFNSVLFTILRSEKILNFKPDTEKNSNITWNIIYTFFRNF